MGEEKRVAIMFIHGILGTPKHFDLFVPLVPSDWSVCNLQLKGHGKSVKDFSRASMTEWKQQVKESLDELRKEHDQIVLVAHSMGTLFAIHEAVKNQVAELFLLNVPLKIHITARLIKTVWRVFTGNIKPEDKWSIAAKNAYGIEKDYHILRYLGWIPRYLELFLEIKRTKKLIQKLSVPTNVYLSLKDEMVSEKTYELLKDNNFVTVKMLNKSGHFYYFSEDISLLNRDFKEMVKRVKSIRVQ